MKKSDAVELIAKRLNPIGICDSTCEEVLDILLEAGMLPPQNRNKYDPVPTVTPTGNHEYSWIREWEKE